MQLPRPKDTGQTKTGDPANYRRSQLILANDQIDRSQNKPVITAQKYLHSTSVNE
jgi:hypothetical protein